MANDTFPLAFYHRSHTDGTVDSICPVCYRTVASADLESALARFEGEHDCDPKDLEEAERSEFILREATRILR